MTRGTRSYEEPSARLIFRSRTARSGIRGLEHRDALERRDRSADARDRRMMSSVRDGWRLNGPFPRLYYCLMTSMIGDRYMTEVRIWSEHKDSRG